MIKRGALGKTAKKEEKAKEKRISKFKRRLIKKEIEREKSAKPTKPIKSIKMKDEKIDLLLKNTMSLQKVLINLSENISNLSGDISKMLNLFEETSKSFEGEKIETKEGLDPELSKKVQELIEQNKVIAKGIVLIESVFKEKVEASKVPSTTVPSEVSPTKKLNIKPLPGYTPKTI